MGADGRADDLPVGLRRRDDRLRRLQQAKKRLDDEQAQRQEAEQRKQQVREAREAEAEAVGGKVPGRPPAGQAGDVAGNAAEQTPEKVREANTTDPDSRLLKTKGGYEQGYNAQAMVGEGQIVIAAELTQDANDVGQLAPMIEAAQRELAAAGAELPIGTVLADTGYFSDTNAALDLGPDLLIATTAGRKLGKLEAPDGPQPDRPALPAGPPIDEQVYKQAEGARRAEILARWDAGQITIDEAVTQLGIKNRSHAYTLRKRWQRYGEQDVTPRYVPRDIRGPSWKEWMAGKLATPEGKATYAKRSGMIEPVFGQHKHARRMRRFSRRGLNACASEWKFMNACHNLLKLAATRVPQRPSRRPQHPSRRLPQSPRRHHLLISIRSTIHRLNDPTHPHRTALAPAA